MFDIPLEPGEEVPVQCVDLYNQFEGLRRDTQHLRDMEMREQCNTTLNCQPTFVEFLDARIESYIVQFTATQNALAVCVALNK